jgi:ribonuclease P protein component
MRRSGDFSAVVRRGVRVRRGSVVVHQLAELAASPAMVSRSTPIVGLVVGKTVGGSVVRHRVARRLRAQLADRVQSLPARSATVVRALPESATVDSAQLGRDLDAALGTLNRRSVGVGS